MAYPYYNRFSYPSQPRIREQLSSWDRGVYGPTRPTAPVRANGPVEYMQYKPQPVPPPPLPAGQPPLPPPPPPVPPPSVPMAHRHLTQPSDANYSEQYYLHNYYSQYSNYNSMSYNNATNSTGYYSSYPYNTQNQNYDRTSLMTENPYINHVPSNYMGYDYAGDQTGMNFQTHEARYGYLEQQNNNKITITECTTNINENHRRDNTAKGTNESQNDTNEMVVKKEGKSAIKGLRLEDEILNTKQLLSQDYNSNSKDSKQETDEGKTPNKHTVKSSTQIKDSKEKTKSASKKLREKKSGSHHCKGLKRTVVSTDRRYRSLSPASYKRYMDFQRFMLKYSASAPKHTLKRKICTQRKKEKSSKRQLNTQKYQTESINQRNSHEKIHELEENCDELNDEVSDEQNKQGEQDKEVQTKEPVKSKLYHKRKRQHSTLDLGKATDENDNQEITQKENSDTASQRYVKVRLSLSIENASSASDCSEPCPSPDNLSFVEEIDVDKIVHFLNTDPNQETVPNGNNKDPNIEENKSNQDTKKILAKDANTIDKNASSKISKGVQCVADIKKSSSKLAQEDKLIDSSNYLLIDLTKEKEEEEENNKNQKMSKAKPKTAKTDVDETVTEPISIKNSSKNMPKSIKSLETCTTMPKKKTDKSSEGETILQNKPTQKKAKPNLKDAKVQLKESSKKTNIPKKCSCSKCSKNKKSTKSKSSKISKRKVDKKRQLEKQIFGDDDGDDDDDDCIIIEDGTSELLTKTKFNNKSNEGRHSKKSKHSKVKGADIAGSTGDVWYVY
ncbi:hypothetical protein HF086_000988 [Spodoptera exigua]|uniref:Uncharacterized protein n=1 Tax=Spodoptera exigua TaxID=7107 RepID=A0A922M5Z7_SPOEX|nr:hypothetical protein HF086_000988 [Spodoptera exigua]